MKKHCDVQGITQWDQPNPVTTLWSTSCQTICCGPGGRGRRGRPSHVSENAVSCTRLSQSKKASSCERFVSNAHHRLKNLRPRMGAGTLIVPIERSGWGFRRRDRGTGAGVGRCFLAELSRGDPSWLPHMGCLVRLRLAQITRGALGC